MDPQATWEELLRCWSRREFEEARQAAEALRQWLDRGGFAPELSALVPSGDELHRVVVQAVLQHVLDAAR